MNIDDLFALGSLMSTGWDFHIRKILGTTTWQRKASLGVTVYKAIVQNLHRNFSKYNALQLRSLYFA